MAITITTREGDPISVGGTSRYAQLDIALDTSYPAGGESLTPASVGFSTFDCVLAEPSKGYTFEYDHTNSTLKAFRNAPPIVIEEEHSTVTHYITLDYPAAWIMSVAEIGTAKVWNKTGMTTAQLATNQFCLRTAIVDGERTQITLNEKTATVYVTYVTQAWDDVYNLLVQDEAVVKATTAATDATLAYPIMGFGYCATSTGGTLFVPIDIADTNATGEVAVDYAAGTATGAIRFKSTQIPLTTYVTYLKTAPSGSWIEDRYIPDENISGGSSGKAGTAGLLIHPVLLWGCSGYAASTAGTAARLIPQDGTTAVQTFKIYWGEYAGQTSTTTARTKGTLIRGGGDTTGSIRAVSYVWGYPWEVSTVPLEVPNGADLSNVTDLKISVWGR